MKATPLPELAQQCVQYDQYFRNQMGVYNDIVKEIDGKAKKNKKDKGELAVCDRELRFNNFLGAMNAMMIDMIKHMSEVKGIDLGLDKKTEPTIVKGEFNKGDNDE